MVQLKFDLKVRFKSYDFFLIFGSSCMCMTSPTVICCYSTRFFHLLSPIIIMQPTNHAATTYCPLRYITAPAARCRFSTVRLGASRRVGLRVRAEAEPSSLLPPPAFPKFPCLASNSRNPKASGPNQTLRASARAPTRDIAKFHVPGRQRPTGMIRIPRGSARGAHAARPPPVSSSA